MSQDSGRKHTGQWLSGLVLLLCSIVVPLTIVTPVFGDSDSFTVGVEPIDVFPPEPVIDLVASTGPVAEQAILKWTAPDENSAPCIDPPNNIDRYSIRYATFSIDDLSNDTTAWWISTFATEVTFGPGLAPGLTEITTFYLTLDNTYYFAIKSYDNAVSTSGTPNPNISLIDINADTPGQQAYVWLPSSYVAPTEPDKYPLPPGGLRADVVFTATQRETTLSWNPVGYYDDGTVLDISSITYRVYRTDIGDLENANWVDIGTTTSKSWHDSLPRGEARYYTVLQYDKEGVETVSDSAMIIDNSADTNLISLKRTDNKPGASVIIPEQVSDVMYKGQGYDDDLIVKITPCDKETAQDIAVYEFEIYKANDAKRSTVIEDIDFGKQVVDLSIYYDEGEVNSKGIGVDMEKNLALFYYNGLKWIKLGGTVNKDNNKVTINTQHLSKYAIKISLRADSFTATPNLKVFTPKGPKEKPYNEFILHCINPRNATVVGKIYDIRGALVRTMDNSNSSDYNIDLTWNGRINGNHASTGVYIWQIELSGEQTGILNGTVVLVR